MMRILVVGGNGLIGKSVVEYIVRSEEELRLIVWTTRSRTSVTGEGGVRFLDLLKPGDFKVTKEEFHLAFLCAGVNGFANCEGSGTSWRINVDGIIDIAMRLIGANTFVVYPSSESVEWSSSAYSRQRAQVEAVLLASRYAAVVRCGRVNELNCMAYAKSLFNTGLLFTPGVYYGERLS